MKQIKFLLLALTLVFISGGFTVSAQTSAFSYQGRLTDGAAAANGTYEMQFKLFDSAGGATQIGSTITNSSVTVANGIFTVTLDFGATPFAAGANRWLEIGVRKASDPPGFTTLAPRQQLTSSPYSIKTLSADSLSTNCAGCVTDAQINTVSGAKVTGSVSNALTATTAGSATTAESATTAGNVTGVVAIANGGTGSTTKNFVDLTTNQSVNGNKTFGGNVSVSGTFSATLGQTANTVYSSSTLSVAPATGFTVIPGMTTTINVPANYKVLITAGGGVQTTSVSTTGFSTVDVAVHVDGALTPSGAFRRVIALNSGGITSTIANWSTSLVLTLAPGSHTIDVRASGTGGASATANVGGDSSSVLQGELTVIFIKN